MFGLIHRGSLPKFVESEFEHLIAKLKELWLTEHNEDGTHRITPRGFDFVPVGAISGWSTDTAPSGWLFCRGQAISRVDYKALFDTIGTTYGAGNGTTTFNVPDLQQRFPLGKAASGTGNALADTGGAIDHTHSGGAVSGSAASDGAHTHTISGSTANESAHTHGLSNLTDPTATSTAGVSEAQAGTGQSVAVGGHAHFTTTSTKTSDAGSAHAHAAGTLAGDSGGAHTHGAGSLAVGTSGAANAPFLVVNYIILTGRL